MRYRFTLEGQVTFCTTGSTWTLPHASFYSGEQPLFFVDVDASGKDDDNDALVFGCIVLRSPEVMVFRVCNGSARSTRGMHAAGISEAIVLR